VLPWYIHSRVQYVAALLAGVALGGLLTLALGYKQIGPAAIPERPAAEAIASDRAAVEATPTATPVPAAQPARRTKPATGSRRAAVTIAQATATPQDVERGRQPGAAPSPLRAAPRRSSPQRIVAKRRSTIGPVKQKTLANPAPAASPAPTAPAPEPTAAPAPAAPAPAPTAAPAPASTPAPTATPAPQRPHPGPPGPGADDGPGTHGNGTPKGN
jgi:pyruvate dehydrogenase E2 component (dihydrolipoamide acetyltransferase)